ncbi:MAG: hypothetical protein JHD02_11465 [Thermoleophilaceae bacterium]|nr:hypothetical protein [Thermoleophilaceae bacterium]
MTGAASGIGQEIANNTLRWTMDVPDLRGMIPIKPHLTRKAVRTLLDGVAKKKPTVITPFYAKIGWRLERFSPRLAMRQHRLVYGPVVKRSAKLKAEAGQAATRPKTPA